MTGSSSQIRDEKMHFTNHFDSEIRLDGQDYFAKTQAQSRLDNMSKLRAEKKDSDETPDSTCLETTESVKLVG